MFSFKDFFKFIKFNVVGNAVLLNTERNYKVLKTVQRTT